MAATVQGRNGDDLRSKRRRVSGKAELHNTYQPHPGDWPDQWFEIDCDGLVYGRTLTEVSELLQGKRREGYAPNADMRVFVILTNTSKFVFTSKSQPKHRHSGYPGGLRSKELRAGVDDDPLRGVKRSLWGMLPKNRRGRQLLERIRVYSGPAHPHRSQAPEVLQIPGARADRHDIAGAPAQLRGERAPMPGTLRVRAPLPVEQMAERFRRWGKEVTQMTVIPLGEHGELGSRVEVDEPDGAVLNAYVDNGVLTLSWSTDLDAERAFDRLLVSLQRRGIESSFDLGAINRSGMLEVVSGKRLVELPKRLHSLVSPTTGLVRLELHDETWIWQAKSLRQTDGTWTTTFGVVTEAPDTNAILELHEATRSEALTGFVTHLRAALGLSA